MSDGGSEHESIAARRVRRVCERKFDVIAEQYCGLMNQGATCYMNSILQALFHLPAFRKLVYDIPLALCGNDEDSILWNLKRLFSDLQTSSEAVSTKALTNSFGWGEDDILVEQDTHEFMKILLSSIEDCVKGTEFQNAIEKFFLGRSKTVFLYSDVSKEKVDEFLDLQLAIEGCSDLDEAIQKYTEPEQMVGENQYVDDLTKQRYDAVRKCEFVEIPSVLFIHLERFRYDRDFRQMTKVNSIFAFPEEIDMNQYVPGNNGVRDNFKLYGVVVHSGDPQEGHFKVFLRTSLDDRWYEFNDSVVKVSSDIKAMQMNFGGDLSESTSSAYVLIYVRESDVPWLFSEVPTSMIPQKLIVTPEEKTPIVHLNVWTDDMLCAQSLAFTGKGRDVEVHQGELMTTLCERVAKAAGKPNCRVWYATKSSISALVPTNNSDTVEGALLSSHLFAENALGYVPQQTVLCLSYFYYHGSIVFVSSVWMPKTEKILHLGRRVCTSLGIPSETQCLFFAKLNESELTSIDPNKTFISLALRSGTHIVIQPKHALPEEPLFFSLEKPPRLTTDTVTYYDVFPDKIPYQADDFFKATSNIFKVTIASLGKGQKLVQLPRDITWTAFKLFVSELFELNYDATTEQMVFYLGNATNPLDEDAFETPRALVEDHTTLTVTIIPSKDSDLRQLRAIVSYCEDGVHTTDMTIMLLDAMADAGDLIQRVRLAQHIPPETPLRALALRKNRIGQILHESESLCTFSNPFRVEPIPPDHQDLSDGSFLLFIECVRSHSSDTTIRCPSPFVACIHLLDTATELSSMIRHRLGLPGDSQLPIHYITESGQLRLLSRNRTVSSCTGPFSRIIVTLPHASAGGVKFHK